MWLKVRMYLLYVSWSTWTVHIHQCAHDPIESCHTHNFLWMVLWLSFLISKILIHHKTFGQIILKSYLLGVLWCVSCLYDQLENAKYICLIETIFRYSLLDIIDWNIITSYVILVSSFINVMTKFCFKIKSTFYKQ